ncbi:MAG: hypothetical protein KAH44_09630 [Oricola sp.]|jgi:hypothetical protein|nr:hypothetical protein [Oricola sp.]
MSEPQFATKIRKAALYDDGSERFAISYPETLGPKNDPAVYVEGAESFMSPGDARILASLLIEAADFMDANPPRPKEPR